MPPPNFKKVLQSFLVMLNYLRMFSPMTEEMCEPLQKITSVKAAWTWDRMYQDLYRRANKIIKKDACPKFYHTCRPQYLKTDASGVRLEPDYYKYETAIIAGMMKCHTMQHCHPNALTAKAY